MLRGGHSGLFDPIWDGGCGGSGEGQGGGGGYRRLLRVPVCLGALYSGARWLGWWSGQLVVVVDTMDVMSRPTRGVAH